MSTTTNEAEGLTPTGPQFIARIEACLNEDPNLATVEVLFAGRISAPDGVAYVTRPGVADPIEVRAGRLAVKAVVTEEHLADYGTAAIDLAARQLANVFQDASITDAVSAVSGAVAQSAPTLREAIAAIARPKLGYSADTLVVSEWVAEEAGIAGGTVITLGHDHELRVMTVPGDLAIGTPLGSGGLVLDRSNFGAIVETLPLRLLSEHIGAEGQTFEDEDGSIAEAPDALRNCWLLTLKANRALVVTNPAAACWVEEVA